MLVALILAVVAIVVLGVILLQRKQARESTHERYFSHTLGISEPGAAPAEDETSAP